MKIDATLEIEMFDDQAEEICVEFLKKDYAAFAYNPIIVVPEDVVEHYKLLTAMALVIKYYSTPDDYVKFMEEVHGE